MRRLLLVALPAVLLAGCDGKISNLPTPPPGPGVVPPTDWMWRAEQVEALTLPEARWDLGPDAGEGGFSVTTARGRLLVGTRSGLLELAADGGSTRLSTVEVTGLLTLPSGDALVAQPSGLSTLTGDLLRRSDLSDAFSQTPRLLAREGDALWLGTPLELLRLEGTSLTRFPIPSVSALRVHDGQRVAQTPAAIFELRGQGTAIEGQALSDELPLTAAVPVEAAQVLATLDGGALVRRVDATDGGARWLGVALAVEVDAGQAEGVELLGVDRETGAVWLAAGADIRRLEGHRVSTLRLEGGFSAAAVDENGALFLRQGSAILRLGTDAPVRFSESLKPLSSAQCETCHRTGGIAIPTLETAVQWRAAIDAVLERTSLAEPEGLRMPRGADALPEASLELIRRWKQEGFRP